MPVSVAIRFTHASLQVLAEDHGIDLLHIKGPAVDDALLEVRVANISTTDGAPESEAESPVGAARDRGATQHRRRRARPSGSPRPPVRGDAPARLDDEVPVRGRVGVRARGHHDPPLPGPRGRASTLPRDRRRTRKRRSRRCGGTGTRSSWPGSPALSRQSLPNVSSSSSTRPAPASSPTRTSCRSWTAAREDDRDAVRRLAADLGAEVALAAGTGRLDEFSGARGYALWLALSTGERSLVRMWVARVKAAPTRRAALRTAVHLLVPNPRRYGGDPRQAPDGPRGHEGLLATCPAGRARGAHAPAGHVPPSPR